ncbi:hypothetical protein BGZ54_006166 [Gamsiella multidivaricata]|nr:hypothetical protein BGZ54_006166 [Gamsiella multidivaricata]
MGPLVPLTPPFLKYLFCERGIPTLFPIHNNSTFGDLPTNDDGHCDSAEYSIAIAKFAGINASAAAVLITLTVRFWSGLGDRIGRKRAMQIWAVGTATAQLFPLMVYYHKGISLYFIWIGGLVEGSVGSVLSLIAITHAYAADVTDPEERTVVFGRIIGSYYTGIGLGSVLGGLVAKQFGLIAAFWMLPILAFLNIFYISIIPESLSVATLAENNSQYKSLRNSQSQSTLAVPVDRANEESSSQSSGQPRPVAKNNRVPYSDQVKAFIRGLVPEQLPGGLAGKYSALMLMFIAFLVLMAVMGASVHISIFLLYRFHWSEAKISYVTAIQGLSRLLSMTLLLPLVKRLAPQDVLADPVASIHFDLKLVIVGVLIEAMTMFLYGATPVGEGFFLGGATSSIGAFFFPAIRGILSQSVAPELLGQTLGTLATFESLAVVVGPTLFAWIYGATLETHPSTVFYVAGVLTLLGAVLALPVFIKHTRAMHRRL